jgi:uncharacterized protein (TIGR02466 family)
MAYEIFPTVVGEYDIEHTIDDHGATYVATNNHTRQSIDFQDTELENKLIKCVEEYSKSIGNTEMPFTCTQIWINRFSMNGHIHPHYHSNSMFSCVYYYETTNLSGGTVFENPLPYATDMLQIPKTSARYHNATKFSIGCQKGKVLVFPSWLRHYSEFNSSSEERVTISANFMPYRLGTWDQYNYLKIKE